MALTVFGNILEAVLTELNTDRPETVPEVTKRRVLPGEVIKEPRMAVFLGDENLDAPRAGSNLDPLAKRRLALIVQCADVTDDVDELDTILEPQMIWATRKLGLTRLSGLAHFVRETAVQRQPEYGDRYAITANLVFECGYQTRRDDITVSR